MIAYELYSFDEKKSEIYLGFTRAKKIPQKNYKDYRILSGCRYDPIGIPQ